MARITKETLYLRRDYTQAERNEMSLELAQAHSRKESIENEEKVVKAQFNSRKATVEQRVGDLSRNLCNGFEMANIVCELRYDTPNVGEVTYVSEGGRIEKTRAMTIDERQMEFDLNGNGPTEVISAEKSAENIDGFFDKGESAPAEGDPTPSDGIEEATGPGSDVFEEEVRESMGAPEPFSEKPRLVDARPGHDDDDKF